MKKLESLKNEKFANEKSIAKNDLKSFIAGTLNSETASTMSYATGTQGKPDTIRYHDAPPKSPIDL